MRTNVSHIKSFVECPMKSYFKYGLKVGGESTEAQRKGSAAHAAVAAKMLGQDPEIGASRWITEQPADLQDVARLSYNDIAPIVEAFEPDPEWVVEEVETMREIALGDPAHLYELACGWKKHTIFGTPDAKVQWNGKVWHVQFKTCGQSTPLPVFAECQRTDWHEFVYERMIGASGTLLIMFKKLAPGKLRQMEPQAIRDNAISWHYLVRTKFEAGQAEADLIQILDDMEACEHGERRFVRNREACDGFFHNQLCPFKAACDSGRQELLWVSSETPPSAPDAAPISNPDTGAIS